MLVTHDGGPADGEQVAMPTPLPGARYWAPVADRRRRGWVALARYVLEPATEKTGRRYRYTGVHQERGPVSGMKPLDGDAQPEWSW